MKWAGYYGLGLRFAITSYGPSRQQRPRPGVGAQYIPAIAGERSTPSVMEYPDIFYDATNGTVSFGWVGRSNKGAH